MLQVTQKKLAQIVRTHLSAHRGGGSTDDGLGIRQVRGGRGAMRQFGKHRAPGICSGLNQKDGTAVAQNLRQREIEAGGYPGASVHRHTKAGAARCTAIDRDKESALAPGSVTRIDIRTTEENSILDCHRVQLAGTNTDKGEAFDRDWFRDNAYVVFVALRTP